VFRVNRRLSIAVVFVVVSLGACGDEATQPAPDAGGLAMSAGVATAPKGEASAPAFARVAPDAIARSPQATVADSTRMLIRTASVGIKVDSLEPAMAALRRLAGALGGVVGNVTVSAGEFQVRSATLELRVPSARFDDAMAGMAPIGTVEFSNVSAEDVGEEFVDLRARVANARRLESRLVDLLATRTGKLEDVLAVERELARVREEIERHEGRMRYLGSRVAMSTLQVTVSEPAPVASEPGRSVIGEAFKTAWKNFVGFVAWGIASLGILVPLLVVALVARWVLRRRKPRDV